MHNYIRIEKCTWQTKLQTTCNKNSPLENEVEIDMKIEQSTDPLKMWENTSVKRKDRKRITYSLKINNGGKHINQKV